MSDVSSALSFSDAPSCDFAVPVFAVLVEGARPDDRPAPPEVDSSGPPTVARMLVMMSSFFARALAFKPSAVAIAISCSLSFDSSTDFSRASAATRTCFRAWVSTAACLTMHDHRRPSASGENPHGPRDSVTHAIWSSRHHDHSHPDGGWQRHPTGESANATRKRIVLRGFRPPNVRNSRSSTIPLEERSLSREDP